MSMEKPPQNEEAEKAAAISELRRRRANGEISREQFEEAMAALRSTAEQPMAEVPRQTVKPETLADLRRARAKGKISREEFERKKAVLETADAGEKGAPQAAETKEEPQMPAAEGMPEMGGSPKEAAPPKIEGEPTIEEVTQELEKIPPEDREKIGVGLRNAGFFVQEEKNRFWAKVFEYPAKKFDKKSGLGRFFTSLQENFISDADAAHKKIKEIEERKSRRLGNVGYLASNTLMYGRTVADIVGWTAGSWLRYVTMGGMFFARGADAAKEARLKNDEVIEKTRIHDIEKAAQEAWRIYEMAKEERPEGKTTKKDLEAAYSGAVTKEDLERAYLRNLPNDLRERLTREPEPGVASGIIQKIAKKSADNLSWKIEGKIDAIKSDERFSEKEKNFREKKILNKYSKHLKDLDRIVTQFGTVDAFAMGARFTEKAAKVAVAAVAVETLAIAAEKIWEKAAEMLADMDKTAEDITGTIPFVPGEEAMPETAPEAVPEAESETAPEAEPEQLSGPTMETPIEAEPSFMETAKPGDSVWRMAERQLSANLGEEYQNLNEAQKTHLIDLVKDRIAENPAEFGLSDTDKINAGQKIDFSSILQEKTAVHDYIERAKALTEGEMGNISRNNAALESWAGAHPGEELTSEKAGEILDLPPAMETEAVIPLETAPEAYTPPEMSPKEIEELYHQRLLDIWQDKNPDKVLTAEMAQEIIYGRPDDGSSVLEKIDFSSPDAPLAPDQGDLRDFSIEPQEVGEKWGDFGSQVEELVAKYRVGFLPEEYKAIREVTVKKLLKEIPEGKFTADDAWFGRFAWWNKVNLPHHGTYDVFEFRKHMHLASYIRSLNPLEYVEKMKVGQFLEQFGR